MAFSPSLSRDGWIFPNSEIEFSDTVIGRGAFGEVRVAKWRNIQIAAKKLHSSLVEADDSNLTNVANFKQEIEMLVKLRHPNLVLFIGICGALEDKPVILTELLSCSLYDLLETRKAVFDLPDILDISIDIANGLNYLHSHHPTIVHRDISSKNILLGGNKVKIADLGQAKIFDTGISRQTGMPGAMAYSAPEVLTGKYSEKIDIFSFGILLCQMCIGEYPRIDRREEQNNQAVAKYGCLKSLLNSTVAYQPNLRPTAAFLCENLDLIRSNDRYYPSTRKVYPEKDIGIIARHWMKFQIDTATRDTKIALEQTSRRLLAEEQRWRQEAGRVDEIQVTLNDTTAKLQSATEQIAALRIHQQELQKSSSDLSNANAVLNYQLQNAHNDKIRCQDANKNYEVQIVQQSLEMERLQQLSDQHHDQATMNEQLLHSSRIAEQELIRKNNQLHMQLEMQIKHVRELESRLEQSLTRWKGDKDLCSKETQRCAKLSATCSSLIEKNEQLELEVQRYNHRLKQYDDLPMPEEIKLRLTDQQADMERLKADLNNLQQQKEVAHEETARLHSTIQDLQSSLDESRKEKAYNDQVIVDKEKELQDMDQKVSELNGKVSEKEDENMSLKIELNRVKDLEKKQAAAIKTLHSDIARQSSMIAHLKRLQSSQSINESALAQTADEVGPGENSVLASPYPIYTEFAQPSDAPEVPKEPAAPADDGHHDILRVPDTTIKVHIQQLSSEEGVVGIIDAMSEAENDERLQWRGARALRELILKDEANKQLCYQSTIKIEDLLIRALRRFPRDAAVQGHTIRLLGVLAFGNDLFRRKAGEKGVIQCLNAAMTQHRDDENVNLHVCTAVTNFSHNSWENRSRFIETDGIGNLIESMTRFADSAKYQRQAAWAILTLAASDETSKAFALNGADSAIINAMLKHRDDPGVQQFGSWALSNMALSGDDIARKIKKRGVLEVCKIALETHADNPEVIRQIRHTIGVFSPTDPNPNSSNSNSLPVVSQTTKTTMSDSDSRKIVSSGSPKTIRSKNATLANISSSFSSLSLSRK